ncbi:MAG: D-alanyl-lipoteichoic acid biosynthesis protein DltB [Raoultibacter sp.]
MEFYTQPSFFLFLAAALIPAAILGFSGRRIRVYGLVVSCVFLLFLFAGDLAGMLAFVFFLALAASVTFWTVRSWQSGEKSLLKFRVSLALLILPLVLYKIGAVFDQNLWGFLGISYITFKAIQVLLEVRDGIIKDMNLFDYAYFLLFFAPFTSGPIDRSRRFTEDAEKIFSRDEYADMLARGILLLLAGAVYQMVFATILFSFYTPAPFIGDVSLFQNMVEAIKDSYAYGFYLFFDFAGYSLMAMGASYCFGIKTPRNFKAPFLSLDVKDFWNRWHMTLSFWLRDFVFMRFTRWAMKKKIFKNRLQTACCGYMINFGLMGAWHGLTIDYLAYGAYYGVLFCLTDIYQKKSKFHKKHKNQKVYKAAQWVLTINLIMFGMALFSGEIHLIVGGLLYG